MKIEATWDKSEVLAALGEAGGVARAIASALKKAASTALRDMRSEASKRIRARKRIASKYITRALRLRKAGPPTIDGMEFGLEFTGDPVPLAAYPHRQLRKGVSVEVNRGKRTLLPHAFVAEGRDGRETIFERVGRARLPLRALRGSRPVDALLHAGEAEAVAARGAASLEATFERVLPLEFTKLGGR